MKEKKRLRKFYKDALTRAMTYQFVLGLSEVLNYNNEQTKSALDSALESDFFEMRLRYAVREAFKDYFGGE